MNNTAKRAMTVMVASMLTLILLGCQKEGPAEKAGKEIDKAISSAGDQIQAAGDKIQSTAK